MLYWVIVCAVLIDQGTKFLAVQYLVDKTKPIWFIEGWLGLKYSPNTGAAFSMLSGHTVYLSLFTILAVAMIAWMAWSTPRHQAWLRWGYSLILGGALGNLIDRCFRGDAFLNGHVVDFMQFPWFINNIADDFISIGVGCVMIGFFVYPVDAPHPASPVKPSDTSAPDGPSEP